MLLKQDDRRNRILTPSSGIDAGAQQRNSQDVTAEKESKFKLAEEDGSELVNCSNNDSPVFSVNVKDQAALGLLVSKIKL